MLEYLYLVFVFPLEWIMQTVLEWGYAQTGSYGAGLILVSLAVNILVLPLYHVAEIWQDAERTVQNRMAWQTARIKKVFHGKERFLLLQELYRQHHYHPIMAVRTSVGVLIQIPFFFAAFHLLNNYAPMRGVNLGPIADLGRPDALLFGLNVLPFLMTAINLISASVYTTRLSRRDKIQLYGMAGLFLVLLYSSASGLLFYWTWNNVFSLIKNAVYEKLGVFGHGQAKKECLGHKLHTRMLSAFGNASKKLITFRLEIFHIALVVFFVGIFMFVRGALIHHVDYSYEMSMLLFVAALCMFLLWWIARGYWKNEKQLTLWQTVVAIIVIIISTYICAKYGFIQRDIEKVAFKLGWLCVFTFFISRYGAITLFALLSKRLDRTQITNITLKSLIIISLIIFVYSPSRLMISDQSFQTSTIFAVLTWGIILNFGLLYTLYKISSDNGKIILGYIYSLISVIFTVYTFFITKDYGVLNTFQFQFEDAIFNKIYILIDIVTILVLFYVFTFSFIYKNKLIDNVFSVIIIGVSIFCCASCYKIAIMPQISIENNIVGQQKKYINLSKSNPNILVFMLDSFTGDHMYKIIKECPEILFGFDGFTWYPDTISAGSGTILSVPSLIGGENIAVYNLAKDDGKSLEEKIDKEIRIVFENLHKRKFSSKILACSDMYFINKQNYVESNISLKLYPYKSDINEEVYHGIFSMLFGLFNAIPWSSRNLIYKDGSWIIFRNHTLGGGDHEYYTMKNFPDITDTNSKNSHYIFFDTLLTHLPWTINPKTLTPMKGDPCPETKAPCEMIGGIIPEHYYAEQAALKLLSIYFEYLKCEDVYDNTCIMIVSDHCYGDSQKLAATFGNPNPKFKAYSGAPCALLMVKPFHSHGELQISDALMSTTDVRTIVETVASGKVYAAPTEERVRYHAVGAWQRERHPENFYNLDEIWKISGPKLKRESWVRVK